MASNEGLAPLQGPRDYARARTLLQQAGYGGEKIAMLIATDYAQFKAFGEVAADGMRKAGLNVDAPARRELVRPEELSVALSRNRALAKAFRGLTPGRQRAYAIHISGAKQAATHAARVEKCAPRILAGKGLTDR
jgi:uncharacterized protein YdeI (YjbR/CyaY-like superfamily)